MYAYVSMIFVLFVGCFLLTAALTPAIMRYSRSIGAVDQGGYRKFQHEGMPLLGGLGIALPLVILSLAAGIGGHLTVRNWSWLWVNQRESFDLLFTIAGSRSQYLIMAAGGIAIVALGLIDDIKGMRARWKLLGQITIALIVCLTGSTFTTVSVPFIGSVYLGVVAGGLVASLWVVGLINAFNLVDGIDGLASGIALVGTVALVALSILQENLFVTFAGAALAGSLLGFLLYNFPPAKIFLGDTGSMLIGYALAMLSLTGFQKAETAVIVLAPMLALSLPVFETLVSILRRYLRGVPIFAGDDHHTHHRLLRKGYSQRQVVFLLCGTGVLLATASVMSALISDNSEWAWCPYALYVGTLVNIGWLAGYLRPANVLALLIRRQQNTIYQALSRYVTLRLNSGTPLVRPSFLLELCRLELDLRYIEILTKNGHSLFISQERVAQTQTRLSTESLHVKSSDGGDLLIRYEFNHTPDPNRHLDVRSCLAGIFDGMRIDRATQGGSVAPLPPHEENQSKVLKFEPVDTHGVHE